ncbi:MAG: acyl carrier protein [Acidobacteria bacterium]|nr:acyl carrier protein [Acidobacteriota bacterium]
MQQLEQEIKELIIERLNLEGMSADEIESDAPLFGEGLGLDSIDSLELVLGIEKKYGVKIQDEELGRQVLSSVASLAEFIAKKRG